MMGIKITVSIRKKMVKMLEKYYKGKNEISIDIKDFIDNFIYFTINGISHIAVYNSAYNDYPSYISVMSADGGETIDNISFKTGEKISFKGLKKKSA